MLNKKSLLVAASTCLLTHQSFAWPSYANKSGDKAKVKTPPATDISAMPTTSSPNSAINYLIPPINVERTSTEKDVNVAPLNRHEKDSTGAIDYPSEFAKLDYEQVKADLRAVLTDSKDFWPADYGHYGPFFIRLSWHSAGTYRAIDGRGGSDGGQMRFHPLANWPDNGNLDKARLLIQPVVDKYYPKLSWADAMIMVGDIAMQDMGFKTLGVAGGRVDDLAPDMVYWGPEDAFLQSERFNENGELQLPLAASVMGLIYVNPEGPDGKPDPLKSAERIRLTFGRMGMNDEETVALIAGGHTFGKAHGAKKPEGCGEDGKPECPEAKGAYTNTSGIEGSWTSKPVEWTHEYLTNLFKYEWKLQKGPSDKYQWYAANGMDTAVAPDAHDAGKTVPIMMLTTDLALKMDPAYKKISLRFLENPSEFEDAFARAWFKLIHRDLGPKSRYLGNDFPEQDFLWQDPIPQAEYTQIDKADIAMLTAKIRKSGLSISDRVKTAWASASSFRGSDMRGGANGARVRLEPQRNWEVNEPQLLAKNLDILTTIQTDFNKSQSSKKVSLADLIVLAGNTAIEDAAKKLRIDIKVPFTPGRTDASQDQTDVESFKYLKVTADGFRNYYNAEESYLSPLAAFIDKADLLTLTKREMVVLAGGMRALGATYQNSKLGVFTDRPGTLSNDFFVNLLDNSTKWVEDKDKPGKFKGIQSGKTVWNATAGDLVFGTNPELRLVAFSYANKSAGRKFVTDFVDAWTKVMNLDRFDLK